MILVLMFVLVVLVFDDFAAEQAGKEPDEQERDEERSRERLFESVQPTCGGRSKGRQHPTRKNAAYAAELAWGTECGADARTERLWLPFGGQVFVSCCGWSSLLSSEERFLFFFIASAWCTHRVLQYSSREESG